MRAVTQQAAWDWLGAQALHVADAWERMVANNPEIQVPIHFSDAMRQLTAAADDHREWMKASGGQPK